MTALRLQGRDFNMRCWDYFGGLTIRQLIWPEALRSDFCGQRNLSHWQEELSGWLAPFSEDLGQNAQPLRLGPAGPVAPFDGQDPPGLMDELVPSLAAAVVDLSKDLEIRFESQLDDSINGQLIPTVILSDRHGPNRAL
jgi:hypothetical protein